MRKYVAGIMVLLCVLGGWWAVRWQDTAAKPTMTDERTGIERLLVEVGCTKPGEYGPDCLRRTLYETLTTTGVEAAQKELQTWSEHVAPEPFPCHQIAHFLGRAVYENFGSAAIESTTRGSGAVNCVDGYIHGLLEGVGLEGRPESLVAKLNNICVVFEDDTQTSSWCRHALGHAAAMAEKDSISRALDVCTNLLEAYWSECAGGVLMTFGGRTLAFDWSQTTFELSSGDIVFRVEASERAKLCPDLPEIARLGCWEYLWMLYDDAGGQASERAAYIDACDRAKREEEAKFCGEGLGMILMNADLPDDLALVLGMCSEAGSGEHYCMYGVISSYARMQYASLGNLNSYESVCGDLATSIKNRCQAVEKVALADMPKPVSEGSSGGEAGSATDRARPRP